MNIAWALLKADDDEVDPTTGRRGRNREYPRQGITLAQLIQQHGGLPPNVRPTMDNMTRFAANQGLITLVNRRKAEQARYPQMALERGDDPKQVAMQHPTMRMPQPEEEE